MFLPPSEYTHQVKKFTVSPEQPVCIRSQHLIMHSTIIQSIFKKDKTVYMVYYPNKKVLMIAPYFNEIFRTMHKAKQYMLKEISQNTENAIPLHGIFLDNALSIENRYVSFNADEKMNILTINF